MTAPGPLTLEDLERLDRKAREFYRLGLTHGGMADDVLRLTAALRSVMAERDALRALCDRVREAWGDGIACSCFSFASSCGCNEPAVRAAIEALGPGGEK